MILSSYSQPETTTPDPLKIEELIETLKVQLGKVKDQ